MTPTSSPPQRARGAGFRALYALGFFCLVAAQVSAVWVGYVRGRNDEQLEWLRQTAPVLLQTKCPREIPNHMRTPRT